MQHRQRSAVGGQVEAVLPRPRSRGAPVIERVERVPDRRDGVVEHLEQANGFHG